MKNAIAIILLFAFGTVSSQDDCKEYKENYIPKNLKDAIEYLDCEWSESDKTEFKDKEESYAVTELHFGTGQGIRNGWGLWKGKNRISKFFKSKGIFHPDDMSSIILTSFHRKLNEKPIDLKTQIEYYKNYWDKISKENEKEEMLIEKNFNNFKIGDTVKIAFSKAKNSGEKLKVYRVQKHENPEDIADCYFIGVVTDKKEKRKVKYDYIKKEKGVEKFTLTVSIKDFCGYTEGEFSSTAMYYDLDDIIEKDKEYHFSLEYFIIEKLK
ncbi:DUF6794 domain-containing protein [Mangrovimonas sp. DI 80]|uniref:DUF6794 domain-containing protein n=1 Tax=Mangrovimonas sp. DI 80 TaxID=1779330 RepID=UPI0009773A44|nr:DUF6794 domain-containing protein [Mangrovimonas sp. DI 80]OMP29730.1 hypothetical protein BKM32_15630 [Mangrovimonas sp. DI 80]